MLEVLKRFNRALSNPILSPEAKKMKEKGEAIKVIKSMEVRPTTVITWEMLDTWLETLLDGNSPDFILVDGRLTRVYGIPKNGLILAQRLRNMCHEIELVDSAEYADVILDDIVATGRTLKQVQEINDKAEVRIFVDVNNPPPGIVGWLEFPWEEFKQDKESNITRTIEMIGEDPLRPGLVETPERVVRSWEELYSGYKITEPAYILNKHFMVPGSSDEMIIIKNISVFSTCEHHMLPFYGKAAVGYLPNDDFVVGASKIPRLVNAYARRLQIQERLTTQIANTFTEAVSPRGFGIVMECQHLCMLLRGCREADSRMATSAMRGLFKTSDRVRYEFLNRLGMNF